MIEILNENLRKIDILRKYTFSQFKDGFREIGTFKITAELVQENIYLMDKMKQYYVLFDNETFGIIEQVEKSDDGEYEETITIQGRLSLVLLLKRVIKGTLKFSGITADYVKVLIDNNIVNIGEDKNRYVNINIKFDDYQYLRSVCSNIDKQTTGGYVWDEIESVLEQDKIGIFFKPIVMGKHIVDGVETNISEWELIISAGRDRRKGNKQGNKPVIFSQSLSNIERATYSNNIKDYCNVAYIAGEGEGTDRKWYELEINNDIELNNKKGWGRSELWIDARDIQSEDSEGNIKTDEEYETLIKQRANEKAVENTLKESYESTITNINNKYVYGKDYYKGDLVTIIDDELGIVVDAQVIGVTKSEQDAEEIIDVEFAYGNVREQNRERIEGLKKQQEDVQANMKYLESELMKVKKKVEDGRDEILNSIYSVGDIVFNVSGINPRNKFGGKWILWGKGRAIIGVDPDGTGISSAEKEVGNNTITLSHTHIVSNHTHTIPSHQHTIDSHYHSGPSHRHNTSGHTLTVNEIPSHRHLIGSLGYDGESTASGKYTVGYGNYGDRSIYTDNIGGGDEHTHGYTEYGGTGNTSSKSLTTNSGGSGDTGSSAPSTDERLGVFSVVQNSITCYIWKKVE